MSDRASAGLARTCSGDMYPLVPSTTPGCVSPAVSAVSSPPQSGGRLRELGKTEVEDLEASFGGEEDVLGFEVAVNNAFLVRRGESVRKLDHVVCRFARRKR